MGAQDKVMGEYNLEENLEFQNPNVVKMFLWKTCNDLLPTKVNLLRRGVVPVALCPICMRDVDTAEHILWSFPSTQDVWGVVRKGFKNVWMETHFCAYF